MGFTMKEITLAGGCFWGAQKYLDSIFGVEKTTTGYANGHTQNPSYQQVCEGGTGHVEAVRVEYDPALLPLEKLLDIFYDAIDPTTVDRQGGDVGPQYRTGVYYTDTADAAIIQKSLENLQKTLNKPLAVEFGLLHGFWPAEEYHQKYLDKNPTGYCHIGAAKFARAALANLPDGPGPARSTGPVIDPAAYPLPSKGKLRRALSEDQFEVTQRGATETPFQNEYWDHRERGLYVDVTTGEPLFASTQKFESGCGWPSFTRPLAPAVVTRHRDQSHGLERCEVRSRAGNAHLGHVFTDGPAEAGGLRYCINSAALRFVPYEEMDAQGYGYLKEYIK